jgi:hypothetical protein
VITLQGHEENEEALAEDDREELGLPYDLQQPLTDGKKTFRYGTVGFIGLSDDQQMRVEYIHGTEIAEEASGAPTKEN